jgi:death on curing protein
MKHVSIIQVLQLHTKMIQATGGADGVRNQTLLESALYNAFSTFDGKELYLSIEDKCANICFCIIKNHPFIDGNKRMGLFIMLILLEYNNVILRFDQRELVNLGLGIADGSFSQEYIVSWIKEHEV